MTSKLKAGGAVQLVQADSTYHAIPFLLMFWGIDNLADYPALRFHYVASHHVIHKPDTEASLCRTMGIKQQYLMRAPCPSEQVKTPASTRCQPGAMNWDLRQMAGMNLQGTFRCYACSTDAKVAEAGTP